MGLSGSLAAAQDDVAMGRRCLRQYLIVDGAALRPKTLAGITAVVATLNYVLDYHWKEPEVDRDWDVAILTHFLDGLIKLGQGRGGAHMNAHVPLPIAAAPISSRFAITQHIAALLDEREANAKDDACRLRAVESARNAGAHGNVSRPIRSDRGRCGRRLDTRSAARLSPRSRAARSSASSCGCTRALHAADGSQRDLGCGTSG